MMTDQQLINEGYVDGKKSFDYLVERLFTSFDFKKVYKVMKALDWVWWMKDENYGIPNIDTLKRHAYQHLKSVYDNETGRLSTGGFSYGYEDGHLWMTFQIEEAHSVDLC